jgi:hypothetical protein
MIRTCLALAAVATILSACAPKPQPAHDSPFYVAGPPTPSPDNLPKNPDDPNCGAN